MLQIPNNGKQHLCFPQHITAAISKIGDYPLTIVEAPTGYGKTTAVREHVISSCDHYLWQTVYDDSKAAFWSGFCLLFKELDNECANHLAQLGFPDDGATKRAALMFIKNMTLPKQTVVVIDNFHLIDSKETAEFFTYLTINQITNLHIVLISRFYGFFRTEVLSLKKYLYHIKKESFEFNQKEIMDYYALYGIHITASDADKLYALTEGWISALYLLMLNYKESGSFLTSISIHKLIEQVIYEPFSDTIKSFLLSMSIFNSFTLEQATYMTPDADIAVIIDEITGENAFVTLDLSQKNYHIHSLFKNFLTNEPIHYPCFQLGFYPSQKASGSSVPLHIRIQF